MIILHVLPIRTCKNFKSGFFIVIYTYIFFNLIAVSSDTQGYFTRVDIDMSPGCSSSNESRSPNTVCEGPLLSSVKDFNRPQLSVEHNQDLNTKLLSSTKDRHDNKELVRSSLNNNLWN